MFSRAFKIAEFNFKKKFWYKQNGDGSSLEFFCLRRCFSCKIILKHWYKRQIFEFACNINTTLPCTFEIFFGTKSYFKNLYKKVVCKPCRLHKTNWHKKRFATNTCDKIFGNISETKRNIGNLVMQFERDRVKVSSSAFNSKRLKFYLRLLNRWATNCCDFSSVAWQQFSFFF